MTSTTPRHSDYGAAFDAATNPAWEVYKAVLHQLWKAKAAADDQAWMAYQKNLEDAATSQERAGPPGSEQHYVLLDPEAYREALRQAEEAYAVALCENRVVYDENLRPAHEACAAVFRQAFEDLGDTKGVRR